MFSPLSLNGAQISNNRRNGIGNCSSIFLFLFCFFPSRVEFRIDRIRHVFPHRPFPLSIKRNRVRARETTRDFHPFLYYRLLICPINKSNIVKWFVKCCFSLFLDGCPFVSLLESLNENQFFQSRHFRLVFESAKNFVEREGNTKRPFLSLLLA